MDSPNLASPHAPAAAAPPALDAERTAQPGAEAAPAMREESAVLEALGKDLLKSGEEYGTQPQKPVDLRGLRESAQLSFPAITAKDAAGIEAQLTALERGARALDDLKRCCTPKEWALHMNYIKRVSELLGREKIDGGSGPARNPALELVRDLESLQCTLNEDRKSRGNLGQMLDIALDVLKASKSHGPLHRLDLSSTLRDLSGEGRRQGMLLRDAGQLAILGDQLRTLAGQRQTPSDMYLSCLGDLSDFTAKEGPRAFAEQAAALTQSYALYNQLKPGAGGAYCDALAMSKSGDLTEFNRHAALLRRYTDGLALQGEPNLQEGLGSFRYYGIKPTPQLIDDLLTIHSRTGFLRFSRLSYLSGDRRGDQQKMLEDTVHEIARCVRDPQYKKDGKVAAALFPGADDFIFDALSFHAGRSIEKLLASGGRVIPFEVNTDAQLLAALQRTTEVYGRDKVKTVIIDGHGSTADAPSVKEKQVDGRALNLGASGWERAYTGLNPEALAKIKARSEGAAPEPLPGRLPLWKVESTGNTKLTEDQVFLDVNDPEVFQGIGKLLAPDAVVVLYSCGAAAEPGGAPSLGRVLAARSGLTCYAATQPISNMELVLKHQEVADVRFFGGESTPEKIEPRMPVPGRKFVPKRGGR